MEGNQVDERLEALQQCLLSVRNPAEVQGRSLKKHHVEVDKDGLCSEDKQDMGA